jgi:hypothetical protein
MDLIYVDGFTMMGDGKFEFCEKGFTDITDDIIKGRRL